MPSPNYRDQTVTKGSFYYMIIAIVNIIYITILISSFQQSTDPNVKQLTRTGNSTWSIVIPDIATHQTGLFFLTARYMNIDDTVYRWLGEEVCFANSPTGKAVAVNLTTMEPVEWMECILKRT